MSILHEKLRRIKIKKKQVRQHPWTQKPDFVLIKHLISDHLAKGDLIELIPTERMETPLAYWLIFGPRSGQRPEVQAFCE